MSQLRDLLGDPILPEVDYRGRPAHEPTEEKRLEIAGLVAEGWDQARIAIGVGLSEKTLRKYYSPELKNGRRMIEAAIIRALLTKGLKDASVPALRILAERYVDPVPAAPGRAPLKPVKEPKLGKKEQAAFDAQTPGTTTSMGQLMARAASLLN